MGVDGKTMNRERRRPARSWGRAGDGMNSSQNQHSQQFQNSQSYQSQGHQQQMASQVALKTPLPRRVVQSSGSPCPYPGSPVPSQGSLSPQIGAPGMRHQSPGVRAFTPEIWPETQGTFQQGLQSLQGLDGLDLPRQEILAQSYHQVPAPPMLGRTGNCVWAEMPEGGLGAEGMMDALPTNWSKPQMWAGPPMEPMWMPDQMGDQWTPGMGNWFNANSNSKGKGSVDDGKGAAKGNRKERKEKGKKGAGKGPFAPAPLQGPPSSGGKGAVMPLSGPPHSNHSKGMGKGPMPVPTGPPLSWVGRICQLAREPHTSRLMQKELRESCQLPNLVHNVVQEIASGFAMLMGDPVANYFCQVLLDVTPGNELEVLVSAVANNLGEIALSRHGTCAVQKLIHATIERAPNMASVIITGLLPNVVQLTNDLHGHYVIQCCLDTFDPRDSAFILHAMRGHCKSVATHRQGCLVLQKCFDRVLDDDLVALAEEIARCASDLAQDPFANYVVQHVLRKCPGHWVQNSIAGNLCPEIVGLCCQKFSSNVIELCFSVAKQETRAMVINALANSEGLGKVVKDQYGNYVMQSILSTSSQEQVARLLQKLRPALEELDASPQGRRVLANLRKKCPQLAPYVTVTEEHIGGKGEMHAPQRRSSQRGGKGRH